ncbi:hypothetical protein IC229_05705 [Spirosoma sp. BT702]|uniref:Uncharacterized protein n=1 Tax=Spirosoma profusum TaxID=2771354 RepID=A0A926XUR7_9BACT|nr:hypothetical protein [Spirosoma profusum]MBD2700120.1 hypothetical protein [Spirosoma profusum]
MFFKLTMGTRKPLNKLEEHLIAQAKTLCQGKGPIYIKTLEHVRSALYRELELYTSNHHGVRASSVSIQYVENGLESQIWILPGELPDKPTATIALTEAGIDHQQVQDSLIIPLR